MSFDVWLAYVVATAVISLLPGPSVMMVVGQSLAKGRKAALLCVAGDVFGGVFVMTASYVGLGAILATSAMGFALVKWAGVAYMAYLGLQQLRAARRVEETALAPKQSGAASWRAGFFTGILNPKAIMFYMAFLAQFINPNVAALPQFLILMVTSSVVVAVILGGYGLAASWVSTRLQSKRAQRRMHVGGGLTLLGGSAVMAIQR
ncbi:LysE family translocator [Epibacterium ulvae]|uniref:LysE family translocator n=1 Tax=Epibacterium ulvae TaxID=1156985 RepID=UPI001BFC3995|nr:LysE family translocator [Epibacterium ulvae]MBT8155421.1 LysE family translocator [Epibacterium ulvae]